MAFLQTGVNIHCHVRDHWKIESISCKSRKLYGGLKLAYDNGLEEVLDLATDKEALAAAVRVNAHEYRTAPFDDNSRPNIFN